MSSRKTIQKDLTTCPSKEYDIMGIYYVHPKMTWGADGEVMFGRVPIVAVVGTPFEILGRYVKTVKSIEFKESYQQFYIHFDDGCLFIIPYTKDIEIFYQPINATKK